MSAHEIVTLARAGAAGRLRARGRRRAGAQRRTSAARPRSAPTATIEGATLAEQFDVAAGNVVAALRAAGGTPEDIVSMQIFVTDVAEYQAALRELGAAVEASTSAAATRPPGLFGVMRLFDDRGEDRADGGRGDAE